MKATKKIASLLSMLMLTAAAHAGVVISKVFYAGTTKINATTNYTGGEEYIEIHNNSKDSVDITGWFLGLVESESSAGAYFAKDRESGYEVKLKQLYEFPDDKNCKLGPWQTVVIAACAYDHSKDAQNGPDLSNADFEFGGYTDKLNPKATDLILRFSFNSSTTKVNITNGGDAGFVLVKKSNAKHLTWDDNSTWVYAKGKDKGSQYLPFNAYYAEDAVEIVKTIDALGDGTYSPNKELKRFSDNQDKGYVPANQKMKYDGYVAYRKTAMNNDGKYYLFDTNNSCEDFKISNTIGLYEYDTEEYGVTPVKVTIPESGFLPYNAESFFFADNDIYVGYVSIPSGTKETKCNSLPGRAHVFNNAPYILIGTPGEHTIYTTIASRTLATAGLNNWLLDSNDKYVDGVLNVTIKNRYPMKFVNEKGNVRFVRDIANDNAQSMKIDTEKEGRLYILLNYLNEDEKVIKWDGITPEEIIAAGVNVVEFHSSDNSAIYNLQGIKMNAASLPSGIYIKGGKKFVVK